MKKLETYEATIWVGLQEGYSGIYHSESLVYSLCRDYCNKVGACVTVTPTRFIYKDGLEDGFRIGFINYPRFPMEKEHIRARAIELGYVLLEALNQERVSVVCSDETVMLEKEDL